MKPYTVIAITDKAVKIAVLWARDEDDAETKAAWWLKDHAGFEPDDPNWTLRAGALAVETS